MLWYDTNVSENHFEPTCRVKWSMLPPSSSWRWRQYELLKRWYPTTTLQGVTTQKTSTWNLTVVKASKLEQCSRAFVSVLNTLNLKQGSLSLINFWNLRDVKTRNTYEWRTFTSNHIWEFTLYLIMFALMQHNTVK
jgi:hypothetical protein